MKNQYLKDVTDGSDRGSVAILMAMLAHEQYPEFKQQMESFFGMSQARHWDLFCYFEKDYLLINDFRPSVITLWGELMEFSIPLLQALKFKFVSWSWSTYILIAILTIIHVVSHIIDANLALGYYFTIGGLPIVIGYHLLAFAVMSTIKGLLPKPTEKFETLQDTIGLTVTCPIEELYDAYDHFRCIPNVHVVAMEPKLDTLNMIEVTFIYNKAFIGTI